MGDENKGTGLPLAPEDDIDTLYLTQQNDTFASGLAGEIGSHAYMVWHAVKSHANFATGEAWPSIRRLMRVTQLASGTVQWALKKLQEAHLLRESRRKGQSVVYVARERINVRMGKRIVCVIVLDYVPDRIRQRLAKLREAAAGGLHDAEVWAEVEILPGPGFVYDPKRGTFVTSMPADELPPPGETPGELVIGPQKARRRLKATVDALRKLPKK